MARIFVLLLILAAAAAGESDAIIAFRAAMAGEDGTAKRDVISALVPKSAGTDDEILPLLVGAISDRQGGEAAIRALRARTGLTPPGRSGASAYPGYPPSDKPEDWQAWLTARTRDLETKRKLEELTKKPAPTPAAETPANAEAEAGAESTPTEGAGAAPRIPTEDLGRLDRIVYKSGRTLIAYVRSKRLDGDGNLVSVRVVHADGVGEEVIDAGVIARIEDDIE